MEDWKEHLENNMEEGKLPLTGEVFARKAIVGAKLEKYREAKREKAFAKRQNATEHKRAFGRSGYISWKLVAMFILLFGVGGYYFISEEKITAEAVAINHTLPDGSSVQLMQNSCITYNKMVWLWERKLHLLGNAYFNVTSGKTFTVKTEAGSVRVLGTKFLIEQKGKTMTVNCEEGCVKVETPVGERTLNSGESVRCNEQTIEPVDVLPEMFGYEEDPLVNVVADIEHIFKVKVVGCEKYDELYFSGAILTRDLEETLKRVFGSLEIKYRISGKEIILE